MHSLGEEVLLDLNAEWGTEEDDGQMIVDSHEEDWSRLHDVRVTGTVRQKTLLLLNLSQTVETEILKPILAFVKCQIGR